MKLKHSVSGINISLLQILFTVFTVLGVLVRTYQRFTQIESDTGFYKEINFPNTFFMVFIILVPLIFIVLSFLSSEAKSLNVKNNNSRVLFAVSMAASLGFVYDAVKSAADAAELNSSYLGSGFNEIPFLKARTVFAVLSAVYMVFLSLSAKGKIKKASKLFLLPLAPAVWSAVRLFPLFAHEISYIQVSDLFSEIFMLVFASLFFFYLASAISGIGFEGYSYKLVAYGLSVAFLSAVINIPKFIATVIDAESYIVSEYPLSAVDFMVFLFALSLVVTTLNCERDEEKPLEAEINKD